MFTFNSSCLCCSSLLRCCEAAGIETRICDAEGHVLEHIDVHSLRRTFATNRISSGADSKSVQELLGHRTLDMTMRIYAKIHGQTKRRALGKLSYGQGSLAPEHIVEYPAGSRKSVRDSHPLVTEENQKKAEGRKCLSCKVGEVAEWPIAPVC